MPRAATEADIPWMVERARERHEMFNLGKFDPEYVSEIARHANVLIDGESLLWGAELPNSSCEEPAINTVLWWEANQAAWGLLEAHEESSALPSGIFLPAMHPRYKALKRAFRMRGYVPHETLMVKRWDQ